MPKEVLIADPNVTAQEEFEKIFENMGAQLIFAENGEDALLKIKLYKPDLVIADVTMSNKDGFELCKMVKANPELQQIPFVLLAGIFEEIDKSEQERVGADGVVTKPLDGEKILPLVKGLLKRGPVSPPMEKAEGSEAEAGVEEGRDTGEGFVAEELGGEAGTPREAEVSGVPLPAEEESIIELTDVVDEEATLDTSLDLGVADESPPQMTEGEAETTPKDEDEGAVEISFDEIELGEPGGGVEVEGLELTEGEEAVNSETSPQAQSEQVVLPTSEVSEEVEAFREEKETAELEEEIDRRIDLVLGEEQAEEDTLLELEEAEGEKTESLEKLEALEAAETEETGTAPPVDEESRDEEETILELAEDEELQRDSGGTEPPAEESPVEGLGEPEGEREKGETSRPETLELASPDLEELSIDDLGDLGETVDELGELPVGEELEGLFGEGEAEEIEAVGEESTGVSSKGEAGVEELHQAREDETSHLDEIFGEEISDEKDTRETQTGEAQAGAEAAEVGGTTEAEAGGEREDLLKELEEGSLEEELGEEGVGILDEVLEESPKESGEAFSYPTELIKEENVSEEELDEFQKRLSADFEDLDSRAGTDTRHADERIESLVRKGVEQVIHSLSENVIPELTQTIAQVASERIEKVVQQVVPDLAESAIRKEIERLQKEGE